MTLDSALATAQIVDACLRLKKPYRIAPVGIQPVIPMPEMISGPVLPVRHYGSVDIFLEALETAARDSILVIDNQNRQDEACIGDLAVLEFKDAGIKAVAVWGLHRDTLEIQKIGLPIFSYGVFPSGPTRLDNREREAFSSACFGGFEVTKKDTAFLDQDGLVFVATQDLPEIMAGAQAILATERAQASAVKQGHTLRQQFSFSDYLQQRQNQPDYTFRQHLSSLSKAIEE